VLSFANDSKTFIMSMGFRAIVGVPASLLFYFPLSMKRDLSAFRYGGVVTVLALLYCACVMVIEQPFYWEQNYGKQDFRVRWCVIDWNVFTTFSITFFSYTC
jgi:amino acid permease